MSGEEISKKAGPLAGFTIIEMAGLGPVPLAGLILSEMGARVVRVERLAREQAFLNLPPQFDLDRHGREIIRVDLKHEQGTALMLQLIAKADAIVEGFRPGVMERLGLGPDALMQANPGLVYGRMTGFGQDGPLAARAGHDLTYLALSGALHAIGPKGGKPVPPLNLAADYGGGTMFLIAGLLAALLEKSRSGKGQIIDAAMIDGVSMLSAPFFAFLANGIWQEKRGSNLLDSGTPFYDTYECSDGQHVAVACLEPQFFAEFCRILPLPEHFISAQYDKARWPQLRTEIAHRMREKTRDEWAALFEETDACVAPVLSFSEAPDHPQNRARNVHVDVGSLTRPAPAPRFSRTQGMASQQASRDMIATMEAFGIDETQVQHLASTGIVGQ